MGASVKKMLINEYNETRAIIDKSLICHAPFVNMNFDQSGIVNACCYNRSYILGKYPQNSLSEIWFGNKSDQLRNYISKNDLSHGCQLCARQLAAKNFSSFKAKHYDIYPVKTAKTEILRIWPWRKKTIAQDLSTQIMPQIMPQIMEFELSNICNLECVMCNGHFSSSIRQNRDKLPPIVSPYDDKFIEQILPFIPYLKEMKFLGGEPFMIPLYYNIWDKVLEINPTIRIHITTNATMLNSRIKDLLQSMNVGLNISVDSVVRETYEKIRVNASFDKVMENIYWLKDYTTAKGNFLWFSVCPITLNAYELPDLIKFTNDNDIGVYFNTVTEPKKMSLKNLPKFELAKLIKFYQSNIQKSNSQIGQANHQAMLSLISQLEYWAA